MNNSEKMYEAITGIRDDIVENAGEYKFRKKKKSFAWIGYAAAACLVLGTAVFGISRLAKAPAKIHEASVPTEEVAQPTDNEKTVLYGYGKKQYLDEFDPDPGEMNVTYPLAEEILKAENADCLFAVRIALTHTADEIWDELNEEWRELTADPDYKKYCELYEEWEKENFGEMIPEEIADYYGWTIEEFLDESVHPYRGYVIMHEDFEAYLKGQLDPEEYALCVAAHERVIVNDDEMFGSRTRIKANDTEALRGEYERLLSLGLNVELDETGLIGYLSGEELANFPCSDRYGYSVYWIGAENIMDE